MANATLLVVQGRDQGERFEIGETEVGIGRGAQNAVRILDTEASRTHARITFADGQWTLSDQSSSNGTYINGHSVRSHELADGDEIQIGRTILLFTRHPAPREDSHLVAKKVALVNPHDAEDRSNIIGPAVASDDRELVGGATSGAAQNVANLQVLYRIAEEAVRPSISLEQMLQRILDLTLEAVGADRGCMLLRDPESGDMTPQVFSPLLGGPGDPMPVSRSIVDYVIRSRQGVRTSDARTDTRFTPGQSILQAGIREAICVPMQGRYQLMGVIYVDITTPPERVLLAGGHASRFTEDLLRLMVAIGRQSALAIEDNRYQQALVKAERLAAVGQTIAILSHHIKNILQGVRGGSYLIDMGLRDHNDEMVRKGWNIVEKNQGKIYHMVMDMLTFSKERQPAHQRALLAETVGEVCELMQARAEECQIDFAWTCDDDIPQSMYDPEGIHRAVLNIVINAFDAVEGEPNPHVAVKAGYDAAARTVYVAVDDNGPGISPEVVQKIFNLFESSKGARGTGLGLAVSQKIIREHGGEISVQSTPGSGSRFLLEWPFVDEDRSGIESRTQV